MSKTKLKIIKSPKKRIKRPSSNLPAIVEKKDKTLSLADPAQVMGFGKVLKDFIVKNDLSVKIGNADYSMVDGWKYAGLSFGLTAIPTQPKAVHKDGEYITILYAMKDFWGKDRKKYQKEVAVFVGFFHHREVIDEVRLKEKITSEMTKPHFAYECDCDIVKLADGSRVTRGGGYCSNLELLKSGFDEYSVRSMAETRSIGKGYRNLLGFVMKSAGMGSTPAEEMNQDMGEKFTDHKEVTDLPGITDQQFQNAMKKVIAGEWTVETVKLNCSLTEVQEKSLEIAEQSRKLK